jgi:lysophospholipid acyltransferase (LPLAT)-like uncharacterized protein
LYLKARPDPAGRQVSCDPKRYNHPVSALPPPAVASAPAAPNQPFTPGQRILLSVITGTATLVLRLLGPTLRFAISWEDDSPGSLEARPFVYSFWHSCMLPAMYLWRGLQIRVMSSDSFDGEYTGRIMRNFGFVKVRGSSTRGAVRALLGMRRELEAGWTVAFTIDGPKGPRYVAKPGPVVLARSTGIPMVVFHMAVERAWVLKTWDGLMIPKPFSRVLMRVSRKIAVPRDADDAEMERSQNQLQLSLDRVREFAEANIHKAGSDEFPIR